MKNKFYLLLALVVLCSHDLYLKLDSYFLEPNTMYQLKLFNGTFDESENIITRDRILDASFVGNNERKSIAEEKWYDIDSTETALNFKAENSGTWLVGVSTKARNIEMTAEKFNSYLEHDGVLDMLKERKRTNALNDNAVEKYSKHVKAIFQVGDSLTNDWKTVLNYPIEFIPQENPYAKHTGDSLKVQLLSNGKPLANQLVYADYRASENGHSHSHSHDESHSHDDENHTHTAGQQLRTNENGEVVVNLTNDGFWFVRTIHLVNSSEEGLTHESNWATLTFEVTHQHEHSYKKGIPDYIFWIISLVVIGGMFIYFSKKNNE